MVIDLIPFASPKSLCNRLHNPADYFIRGLTK